MNNAKFKYTPRGGYIEIFAPDGAAIAMITIQAVQCDLDLLKIAEAVLSCTQEQNVPNANETTDEVPSDDWCRDLAIALTRPFMTMADEGRLDLSSIGTAARIRSIIKEHAIRLTPDFRILEERLKIKDAIIQEKNATIAHLNKSLDSIERIAKTTVL